MISNLLKNKFISNMSWMVGGKIFQMAISLFIGMFTARFLGPTNYGVIGYVASYVAFFTSLCTLGLNGIIVKELVNNPEKQGEYIFTAIVMRLVSSAISVIALQILMYLLHPNDQTILVITVLSSISLLFGSFDIINYWYQSKMQSKVSVILTIAAYIIVAVYKVLILVFRMSVAWFAFASTLDIALIAVFLILSYFKNGGQKLSFSMQSARSMLSQSYHFILSGVMVAVFAQTDKIMIGQFLNITEVGYYSVAITICGLWSFVPTAIIDSARPVIMEQKNGNGDVYVRRIKQLYCALIWLSVAYGMFVCIFAKLIISILYGSQFLPAINSLRISVWYSAFSFLGAAKNIWLICDGKQKYEKWFTLCGATTNVVLNAILIPIMGIEGAAVATLITQIVTNFVLPAIPKATRDSSKYMVEAFFFHGVVDKATIKNFFKRI